MILSCVRYMIPSPSNIAKSMTLRRTGILVNLAINLILGKVFFSSSTNHRGRAKIITPIANFSIYYNSFNLKLVLFSNETILFIISNKNRRDRI